MLWLSAGLVAILLRVLRVAGVSGTWSPWAGRSSFRHPLNWLCWYSNARSSLASKVPPTCPPKLLRPSESKAVLLRCLLSYRLSPPVMSCVIGSLSRCARIPKPSGNRAPVRHSLGPAVPRLSAAPASATLHLVAPSLYIVLFPKSMQSISYDKPR